MELTDKQLIKDIKKYSCSDCVSELRNRHIGLVVDLYGKYGGVLTSLNFTPHDFNDEINHLVYTSAKKFDLRRKKIKFSTYLGQMTKFFCLNKINELKKSKTIQSEPEDIIRIMDECHKDSDNQSLRSKEMCDYVLSLLDQFKDKRIIKIFNMRYFSGKYKTNWNDIGLELNLTNQTCINIHNKAIKFLKNKLTSLNLSDKI